MNNFDDFLTEIDPKMFSVTLLRTQLERAVANPKTDLAKYSDYCKAIQLLKGFFVNGRGTATIDNANDPLSYHCVHIKLNNDEFDSTEIKQFTEILNLFDSMLIIGTSKGNIEFSLMMENIYTSVA